MSNSTLYVNLDQFRKNLEVCRSETSARALLIVKANGYGHGITRISEVAIEQGVHALGVVNTEELRVVREGGIRSEVFLVGAVDLADFADAVSLDAHVPIWRNDQLEALDYAADTKGIIGKYQIKVDTGMGRLGVFPEQVREFALCAKRFSHIRCSGVYSHFFGSDLESLSFAEEQLRLFKTSVAEVFAAGLSPAYVHISNSPATIRMHDAHFNLVRLGVIAYGVQPSTATPMPAGIKPIATWTTKLLNIKLLPAGHGVSYGAEYRTSGPQLVGVIQVGYADGFRRYPASVNSVLVHGSNAKVLGRVCMDQAIIDLSDIACPKLGDEVCLLGRQGQAEISADTLSERWGTNSYDVLANIGTRVRRVYT
jgi:alanine racemase